ncbi:MAG TPA: TetR/AcrR family transcriptional regulator [Candidatus Deferrimicrobium sp.]|nr:TetR/AcrR family transcriptional regulator [Candidatus Deferrimicrobium sp.]
MRAGQTVLLDENIVVRLVELAVVTDTFRRLPVPKKTHLYRTAIALFGEYGFDGVTIDMLCERAGISKGSFFQYFPSKSHLLEFAVVVFDEALRARVQEMADRETSPLARESLRQLLEALVNGTIFDAVEEKFYHFVTAAMPHCSMVLEGIDLERHVRSFVERIVRRGVQTGELRRDIDTAALCSLVSSIIAETAGRCVVSPPALRAQTAELLVPLLFDGIRA